MPSHGNPSGCNFLGTPQLWYALAALPAVKAIDTVVLAARPAVWSRRCCDTISGDAPAIPFRRMPVSPPPRPQRAVSLCLEGAIPMPRRPLRPTSLPPQLHQVNLNAAAID